MDACFPLLIRIDLNQLIDKTWEEISWLTIERLLSAYPAAPLLENQLVEILVGIPLLGSGERNKTKG
jgi:hypothetical protein